MALETVQAGASRYVRLDSLTEEQLRALVEGLLAQIDFPLVVLDASGRIVGISRGAESAGIEVGGNAELGRELANRGSEWDARPLCVADGAKVGTVLMPRGGFLGAGEGVLQELASHVAHEMRNPLGTIGGFATLLEREFGPEDRRRRWTRKIIDAVARLDRMVTQLHLYVGPVKSQPRPVDLVEQTREILGFAEVKLGAEEAGVAFEYDFPDAPVYAVLDPHWWQEVLLIICSNAIQALGENGRVTIRIREQGDRARVMISDNGSGIPEEMRGKLFYPFFSSRPDGTGLGLAVARKLLHSMNADIELSSEAGKGTVVRITFAPA